MANAKLTGVCDCCSYAGNWQKAVKVRQRMALKGCKPTVHFYNALLAACERACQW